MKVLVIETEKGTIEADLFEKECPKTVAYFAELVESGFYDELIFFQAIPGYLLKTGCPFNNGLGGNGYFIKSELDVKKPPLQEGVIAFVHAGRDANSTQFIICLDDEWAYHLNPELPRIGMVRIGYISLLRQIKKGDKIISIKIDEREEGQDDAYHIPSFV